MDYLGLKILLTLLKYIGSEILYFVNGGKMNRSFYMNEREFLSILIGVLVLMLGLLLFWKYAL